MAHHGKTEDGITLTIRADYNRTAFLGEYRGGNNYGINTRWQMDEHYDSMYFNGYKSKEDVDAVINDGFSYCKQVKNFLKQ